MEGDREVLQNSIAHYYQEVQAALDRLFEPQGGNAGTGFTPGAGLPELTDGMKSFLSASTVSHTPMPDYRGRSLSLLNLTGNPATGTTKTFPSLVIVARAIRFIQDTGQQVTIVTPSSANKAVALRDAVLRAITSRLVAPDQLNVVVLVPVGSAHKMRVSSLWTDPDLRARNPIGIYTGPVAEQVKEISRTAIDRYGPSVQKETATNLWYTLQIENYLAGDVIRASSEAEFFAPAAGTARLHVQAVSSGYGLLGHALGREMLGSRAPGLPSRYLLVQHLGAPDMVLSLHKREPARPPAYTYRPASGLYEQQEDPRFPRVTFDPGEVLDTTFYTRSPATSPRMNELIRGHGGGGIVVSLAECLERYGQVRSMLTEAGLSVPANPTAVAEWSVIMAMTGALNAIDRDLATESDILVHGTGIYSQGEYEPLSPGELSIVDDVDSMRDLIVKAA